MHSFIYPIITLHRDPQHVSNIAVLIFRRTIFIFAVSGIVTLCMLSSCAPIKLCIKLVIKSSLFLRRTSLSNWVRHFSAGFYVATINFVVVCIKTQHKAGLNFNLMIIEYTHDEYCDMQCLY
jgi:hypothetical protein